MQFVISIEVNCEGIMWCRVMRYGKQSDNEYDMIHRESI